MKREFPAAHEESLTDTGCDVKYALWAFAAVSGVSWAANDDPDFLSHLVAKMDAMHRITSVPHRMADSTLALCRMAYNINIHEGRGTANPAYCDVYVTMNANEPMASGTGLYPAGAVIVKVKLKSPQSRDPILYTVMRKMGEGYDTAHGDWEYAILDGPSKRVLARGRIESCIACHEQYASTDYVTRAYIKTD